DGTCVAARTRPVLSY
nr:Chain C, KAT8 REGULATORY NSL COMPLEX SUBUNIT 1 [Homo sapiens]4CY1_D Chain D, KAT8 REGULATORY NSL COMPLEX SUBUNIT 1 [Homo sapiens]4CY2_D Chain D, KAT8 REGULATORY NSL COMPLEX SUBUNIT 1 [Homo sapiens]